MHMIFSIERHKGVKHDEAAFLDFSYLILWFFTYFMKLKKIPSIRSVECSKNTCA